MGWSPSGRVRCRARISAGWRERWEGTNNPANGAGAAAEADALKGTFQLDQAIFQQKAIILLLPGIDETAIPHDLFRLNRVRVDPDNGHGLDDLLRLLTGTPLWMKPPLGTVDIAGPPTAGGTDAPCSGSPRLLDVRVNSETCGWEPSRYRDQDHLYRFPRRPDYMQFIKVNDVVIPFVELADDLQHTFETVGNIVTEAARRTDAAVR